MTSIKLNIEKDIKQYLDKQKSLIDNHLKKIFTQSNYVEPKELWDALRYSILDCGKRIRGILCIATYESLSDYSLLKEDCLTTACSIELIHAMSLIHDDLPCMDNDDLRRGKSSCHKAFSESTAILTGDAMLSLAFQLITDESKDISELQKLKIVNILAKAFSFGLVPGQILDISCSRKNSELNLTENIYKLKTAELIKAAVLCGANIAFNSSDKKNIIESLSNYGEKIGIAFQIIDDILDITSDTKTLGKTSGKDEKQKKLTFPMLVGIEKSKSIAQKLITDAKSELKSIQIKSSILSSIADHIINRIN